MDLLVVASLLGTPPPARLAALGRGLLAAAPARLATALRRLPLRGGLPARCATSLGCHAELLSTFSRYVGRHNQHQRNITRHNTTRN